MNVGTKKYNKLKCVKNLITVINIIVFIIIQLDQQDQPESNCFQNKSLF